MWRRMMAWHTYYGQIGMGWDGRRGEGQVWYGAGRHAGGGIGGGGGYSWYCYCHSLCCVLDWECKYSIV